MTTFVGPAEQRSSIEVVRTDPAKQVAAGLATAAALVAIAALGLSLDTMRYGIGGEGAEWSISRLAWGERLTGISAEDYSSPSVTWGGPLIVSVLLLTGAALAALVAARGDRGAGWGTAALMSSVTGAALLSGVLAMLWVFGASDTSVGHYVDGASARWGPLVGALGLSIALASASAVLVRRGKPVVLATVEVAP